MWSLWHWATENDVCFLWSACYPGWGKLLSHQEKFTNHIDCGPCTREEWERRRSKARISNPQRLMSGGLVFPANRVKLSPVIQISLQSQVPCCPFPSYPNSLGLLYYKNTDVKIGLRSIFFFFLSALFLWTSLCIIFLFSYTSTCCQHLLSSLVSWRSRSFSGRLQAALLWD